MAKIDNAALKKGGFMAQKQKGFYSLRLHITAGHLDSRQLIGISKVADAFGHGYIHLTSRQAIEIPFINVEDADAAKAMLAEYGCRAGLLRSARTHGHRLPGQRCLPLGQHRFLQGRDDAR